MPEYSLRREISSLFQIEEAPLLGGPRTRRTEKECCRVGSSAVYRADVRDEGWVMCLESDLLEYCITTQ